MTSRYVLDVLVLQMYFLSAPAFGGLFGAVGVTAGTVSVPQQSVGKQMIFFVKSHSAPVGTFL